MKQLFPRGKRIRPTDKDLVSVFKLRRMGETCFLGALPESESGITKVVVPRSKDR